MKITPLPYGMGGEFQFMLVKVVGSKNRYYLYLCVYVHILLP